MGIQMTLVHSIEANYVLRRLQKEKVIRSHFKGRFYSKDPEKAEETFCNIELNTTQALVSTEDLPVCTLRYNSKRPEVAGYYDHGNWFPPTCRVHRFRDVAQMKKCFSNRQLFFLLDSTVRQLHEYYLKTLKLSMSFLEDKGTSYTGPVSGKNLKNNGIHCYKNRQGRYQSQNYPPCS